MPLLLCAPPDGSTADGPVSVLQMIPPLQRQIEPAGLAHQLLGTGRGHLRHGLWGRDACDLTIPTASDDDDDDDDDGDDIEDEEVAAKWRSKKHDADHPIARRLGANAQNHYQVLGFQKDGWEVSDAEIKKAYRRMILEHHPDKKAPEDLAEGEEADTKFKAVQMAYETLSDPKKRLVYDSEVLGQEFDDSIPHSHTPSELFYDVYGAAFDRNSRWSSRKPVPSLGNAKTPIEQVDAFYSFWMHFQSWRDWSYLDEYDLEDGESREERRWMQRQNERANKKRARDEARRISALVNQAYAADPRIKAKHEAAKEARRAARQAKAAARHAKEQEVRDREAAEEAERQRVREEQEEKTKADAAKAKKLRDVAKKRLRSAKQALRSVCSSRLEIKPENAQKNPAVLNQLEQVELLCASLPVEKLEALHAAITASGMPAFDAAAASLAAQTADKAAAPAASTLAPGAGSSAPSGSSSGGSSSKRFPPWSAVDLGLLAKAAAKFPGGTQDRWARIADYLGTDRDPEDVLLQVKAMNMAATGRMKSMQRTKDEEFKEFERARKPVKRDVTAAPTPNAVERGDVIDAQPQGVPLGDWTAEEHARLEQALAKFPSSMGKERWAKIAKHVGTKSVKQVVARYKQVVAFLKAQKAAAAN